MPQLNRTKLKMPLFCITVHVVVTRAMFVNQSELGFQAEHKIDLFMHSIYRTLRYWFPLQNSREGTVPRCAPLPLPPPMYHAGIFVRIYLGVCGSWQTSSDCLFGRPQAYVSYYHISSMNPKQGVPKAALGVRKRRDRPWVRRWNTAVATALLP